MDVVAVDVVDVVVAVVADDDGAPITFNEGTSSKYPRHTHADSIPYSTVGVTYVTR